MEDKLVACPAIVRGKKADLSRYSPYVAQASLPAGSQGYKQGCLCHPGKVIFLPGPVLVVDQHNTEPGPFRARGQRSSDWATGPLVAGAKLGRARAASMLQHPRFGGVFAVSGILVGVSLLFLNLSSSPTPPSETGLVDLGPALGVWYLAVSLPVARSFRWVDEQFTR